MSIFDQTCLIQHTLARLGYGDNALRINGFEGTTTASAIRTFESVNGLISSGVTNVDTLVTALLLVEELGQDVPAPTLDDFVLPPQGQAFQGEGTAPQQSAQDQDASALSIAVPADGDAGTVASVASSDSDAASILGLGNSASLDDVLEPQNALAAASLGDEASESEVFELTGGATDQTNTASSLAALTTTASTATAVIAPARQEQPTCQLPTSTAQIAEGPELALAVQGMEACQSAASWSLNDLTVQIDVFTPGYQSLASTGRLVVLAKQPASSRELVSEFDRARENEQALIIARLSSNLAEIFSPALCQTLNAGLSRALFDASPLVSLVEARPEDADEIFGLDARRIGSVVAFLKDQGDGLGGFSTSQVGTINQFGAPTLELALDTLPKNDCTIAVGLMGGLGAANLFSDFRAFGQNSELLPAFVALNSGADVSPFLRGEVSLPTAAQLSSQAGAALSEAFQPGSNETFDEIPPDISPLVRPTSLTPSASVDATDTAATIASANPDALVNDEIELAPGSVASAVVDPGTTQTALDIAPPADALLPVASESDAPLPDLTASLAPSSSSARPSVTADSIDGIEALTPEAQELLALVDEPGALGQSASASSATQINRTSNIAPPTSSDVPDYEPTEITPDLLAILENGRRREIKPETGEPDLAAVAIRPGATNVDQSSAAVQLLRPLIDSGLGQAGRFGRDNIPRGLPDPSIRAGRDIPLWNPLPEVRPWEFDDFDAPMRYDPLTGQTIAFGQLMAIERGELAEPATTVTAFGETQIDPDNPDFSGFTNLSSDPNLAPGVNDNLNRSF